MKRQILESTPYEGLKNGTHLDVEVYYHKGYTAPRGYYISVQPVTHGNGMKSVVLLTEASKLLLQANRYSDKQFERAVELGKVAAPELIQRVLNKERAA